MTKFIYILSALFIAIGIALSGYFIGHSIVLRTTFDRYVSVKGLAERTAKADEADWQIIFNYASDDLSDLYKGTAHSQKVIKDFLLKEGFTEEEMAGSGKFIGAKTTWSFSVHKVSLVLVLFNLATAAMSPQETLSTDFCSFPCKR